MRAITRGDLNESTRQRLDEQRTQSSTPTAAADSINPEDAS